MQFVAVVSLGRARCGICREIIAKGAAQIKASKMRGTMYATEGSAHYTCLIVETRRGCGLPLELSSRRLAVALGGIR